MGNTSSSPKSADRIVVDDPGLLTLNCVEAAVDERVLVESSLVSSWLGFNIRPLKDRLRLDGRWTTGGGTGRAGPCSESMLNIAALNLSLCRWFASNCSISRICSSNCWSTNISWWKSGHHSLFLPGNYDGLHLPAIPNNFPLDAKLPAVVSFLAVDGIFLLVVHNGLIGLIYRSFRLPADMGRPTIHRIHPIFAQALVPADVTHWFHSV